MRTTLQEPAIKSLKTSVDPCVLRGSRFLSALNQSFLKYALVLTVVTVFAQARDCATSKEFHLQYAQVLAGSLEDPVGAVLPGIELELLSGRKAVRHLRTDNLGKYDFGEIPPGMYRIRLLSRINAFCAPKLHCGKDRCDIETRVKINPKCTVMVD